MVNKKIIVVAVVILAICLVAGGVYALGSSAAKPEFHLFNIQYVNNSQSYPPSADLITFNIQNLGTVPATDVRVDFVFTVNSSLVAGGQFEYTYTYTRDILQSKEVRDGTVTCGIYELEHRYNFDVRNSSGFIAGEEALAVYDELQRTYQTLQASANHNPDELSVFEKDALMYWEGLWFDNATPSHYVISCAEGIVETEPFPF